MGCAPWDVDMSCCPDWAGYDPAVRARWLAQAVHTIWALTGRQYALCETTVRPCATHPCTGSPPISAGLPGYLGPGLTPVIRSGVMTNIACACGGGGSGCSCTPMCRARLEPGPVREVISVVVGADTVDPALYQVLDGMWLVRTDGGCWPGCQALNRPDGHPDVWTATFSYGITALETPPGVVGAAAVLACEIAKACTGDGSCRLPQRVQTIVREGTSMTLLDPQDFLAEGLTGIAQVDAQIRAFNPHGLADRWQVSTPDIVRPVRVTWSGT